MGVLNLQRCKRAKYLLNSEPITRRIMGNQLSHYYTLKHIINNKYEYSIICQDDVMFKPRFFISRRHKKILIYFFVLCLK